MSAVAFYHAVLPDTYEDSHVVVRAEDTNGAKIVRQYAGKNAAQIAEKTAERMALAENPNAQWGLPCFALPTRVEGYELKRVLDAWSFQAATGEGA